MAIFFEVQTKSSEIVKSFKYNNTRIFSTIVVFSLGDFIIKLLPLLFGFLISFKEDTT